MNDDVKSGGIRKWFRGFLDFVKMIYFVLWLLIYFCVCETRTRETNHDLFFALQLSSEFHLFFSISNFLLFFILCVSYGNLVIFFLIATAFGPMQLMVRSTLSRIASSITRQTRSRGPAGRLLGTWDGCLFPFCLSCTFRYAIFPQHKTHSWKTTDLSLASVRRKNKQKEVCAMNSVRCLWG